MTRKCIIKGCNHDRVMFDECYHHYYVAWGKEEEIQ
jgi:hypothetical protein